jgi:hypothetical protein
MYKCVCESFTRLIDAQERERKRERKREIYREKDISKPAGVVCELKYSNYFVKFISSSSFLVIV